MSKPVPTVASALLAALPAVALAATPSAPPADDGALVPERTVVVTASRDREPVEDVIAPVIVIDRDAIERSLAGDVADLLRFHAGLEIARSGGPGQLASLFIRGAESNHALVLVDGVRINPGSIGVPALQNIAPELVERIEVVKGPRSTLWGTDAIGGVVNVITRRHAGTDLDATAGYGRYGARELAASGSLAGAAGELTLGGSLADADGYPTRTVASLDPANPRSAEYAGLDRGYENRTVLANARTAAGRVELGARLWRAAGRTEYSDYSGAPIDQDFENGAAAVDVAVPVGERFRTHLTLSRAVDEVRQNQPPFPGAANDYAVTRRTAVDWQNDLEAGRHRLTFGVLLSREDVGSLSFGQAYDVGTDQDSFYAQDRIELGRHSATLAAGYTDHETFGGHATWNVEYGFRPRPSTLLTAAAGTAFRAPDATDRFGFGGNPALDPESSRNVELGLRQRLGARHSLGLTAFENEIDDLIQFVFLSFDPFLGENRNVDRARIRGLEASWDYAGEAWQARAGATLQDPVDRRDGERLLRRAKENYTLAVARRLGAHEVALDVLAAGHRFDVDPLTFDRVRLGGYALANVSARLALSPRWALQARVENVLDRDYQLVAGYRTPGRAAFVATRYDFR